MIDRDPRHSPYYRWAVWIIVLAVWLVLILLGIYVFGELRDALEPIR